MNKRELEALSQTIASRLTDSADPLVEGAIDKVAAAIFEAVADNLRTEAEIDKEADATLEQLGRDATGMDRAKLRQGIRERIAKKKRFVL
jgi:hypothetical protein